MSEHWRQPDKGPHQIALKAKLYQARSAEVDEFFGRPLGKYSHDFVHEHVSYTVFCFNDKAEAERFMLAFEGEPFDPRDIGGGTKWMFWHKGRTAKRRAKRSRYDFRTS